MIIEKKPISKFTTIKNIYPDAVSHTHSYERNEDIVTDSAGNLISIDNALIQAELDKLRVEADKVEYVRHRRVNYPDIGDQLDDLYHKGAFSTEMAAKIKKIKDDNPKPE